MKKILILGCCGAGKSTLAQRLHQITQLPLIHLDKEYWQPGWVESNENDWNQKVASLVRRKSWIMDGNYSSSFPLRIPAADTIIYLDYPTHLCMYRVLKRIFTNYGKTRADMSENCPERLDFEFLHYVLTFNLRKRKRNMNALEKVKKEKQIFIFQKDRQVEAFLKNLQSI